MSNPPEIAPILLELAVELSKHPNGEQLALDLSVMLRSGAVPADVLARVLVATAKGYAGGPGAFNVKVEHGFRRPPQVKLAREETIGPTTWPPDVVPSDAKCP